MFVFVRYVCVRALFLCSCRIFVVLPRGRAGCLICGRAGGLAGWRGGLADELAGWRAGWRAGVLCVLCVLCVCCVWRVSWRAGEPQPAPDKDRDPQAAAIGRASLLRRVQASCNPKLIFVCGGCWVGDPEVEFVTTFLGHLPGLSCCGTSSAGRGTGLSRIELEESYSDQFLAGPREPSPQTLLFSYVFPFCFLQNQLKTLHEPHRSIAAPSDMSSLKCKSASSAKTFVTNASQP